MELKWLNLSTLHTHTHHQKKDRKEGKQEGRKGKPTTFIHKGKKKNGHSWQSRAPLVGDGNQTEASPYTWLHFHLCPETSGTGGSIITTNTKGTSDGGSQDLTTMGSSSLWSFIWNFYSFDIIVLLVKHELDDASICKTKGMSPKIFCWEYWSSEIYPGDKTWLCDQIFTKHTILLKKKKHPGMFYGKEIWGFFVFWGSWGIFFLVLVFFYLIIFLWVPKAHAETRLRAAVVG